MLQIATLRVGRRVTPSKWKSTAIVLTSSGTYATFFWYLASAWWFAEALVFTSPKSSELGWVLNGGYGAPDKLNERPTYLRTFFLLIGLMHAALHVYNEESALNLPVKPVSRSQENQLPSTASESVTALLTRKGIWMLLQAGVTSFIGSLFGPILYNSVFRQTLWKAHVTLAKAFAHIPRSEANPPTSIYLGSAIPKGFMFGFLLSLTWQLNLLFFSSYITSPPLKANRPLSTYSKDPNGTLLNGLTAKRDIVRTFAFWELDIISQEPSPERRKDIFSDFERMNQPPLFASMLNAALAVVNSIQTRINEFDPEPAASAQTTNLQGGPLPEDPNIHRLPKLLPATIPAKGPIFSAQPMNSADTMNRIGQYISQEVKTIGSNPNPWSPPLERTKQLAIEYTQPAIGEAHARAQAAQQSPLGRYLLTRPTRLIRSAVLGSPVANAALTVHALSAITGFLVKSLDEDLYGKAVADVPETIITLTRTVNALENFVTKHTGGILAPPDAQELDEVVIIHHSLKTCLKDIMASFQHFLVDVGLSIRDLNEAKNAARERILFKVIVPEPPAPTNQPDQSNDNTREMEEVSNENHDHPYRRTKARTQSSTQETDRPQPTRKSSNTAKDTQNTDEDDSNRPGRLFSVLDKGSAYNSMRDRQKQQATTQQEPAQKDAVSGRRAGKQPQIAAATGNVFGAKDLDSGLFSGGLDRRRTGRVR